MVQILVQIQVNSSETMPHGEDRIGDREDLLLGGGPRGGDGPAHEGERGRLRSGIQAAPRRQHPYTYVTPLSTELADARPYTPSVNYL